MRHLENTETILIHSVPTNSNGNVQPFEKIFVTLPPNIHNENNKNNINNEFQQISQVIVW